MDDDQLIIGKSKKLDMEFEENFDTMVLDEGVTATKIRWKEQPRSISQVITEIILGCLDYKDDVKCYRTLKSKSIKLISIL